MALIYAGNKLIPQPLMSIREEFLKNEQGEIIGSQFPITLTGQMMSWRGSPTSSGTFWTQSLSPPDENLTQNQKLTAIMTKQKAIENLFGTQGEILQVIGLDGFNVFQCNPQVLSINFPEGLWYEAAPYTIELLTTSIAGVTNPSGLNLKAANEEWLIELGDQPESDVTPQSFRLTHNVSAQGLLVYNTDGSFTPPYVWARNFVLPRLGMNSNILNASGVLNVPGYYNGFNQVRSESLNTQAGTFAVSETWMITSGNTIEDFTVNVHNAIDIGVTQVSIQGNIQGLETRDANYQLAQTKYQAASGQFAIIQNNLLNRATSYSNVPNLNPTPLTSDIGRNPVAGNISYSFNYDTRPTNFVHNAKNEIITLVNNDPADLIAVIPILGRAAGPIIQSLSSITEKTRQLTIELQVNAESLGSTQGSAAATFANTPRNDPLYATDIANLIAAATPVANQVFKSSPPQETWQPRAGQWSFTIQWIYQ